VLRLSAVGGAVVLAAGLFAYAGGWLTPHALTPARLVNTLEQVSGGPYAGFRRNHAKGVCFSGFFEGNGNGVALSKAAVFAVGRVPVIGRFALAGGRPFVTDDVHTVRSMAVEFDLPNGEVWRTGINDIPVFPVATAAAFNDLQTASAPDPKTGKPDPVKMGGFFERHPESKPALGRVGGRAISSGFADDTYNSLDAFRFTAADGTVTPVRWAMVADRPFVPRSTTRPTSAPADGKNDLFDDLIAAVHAGPLRWHLVVTVAGPRDVTADPTIAWPPDRKHVDVGMLMVDTIVSEDQSPARDINFDPLVLPVGIAGSDDPILSARSAAYAVSHRRREGEAKQPSAIGPTQVSK
jgi:catalase